MNDLRRVPPIGVFVLVLAAVAIMGAANAMPRPAWKGEETYFVEKIGNELRFDYGATMPNPASMAILERQAEWLREYHSFHAVLIEGHADERGSHEYNLALAQARADTVRNLLVERGVPDKNITTFSYGEERPADLARTEAGWARNRRAVIRLERLPYP
jgi:peptidoglycan-associated lipoprotein